MSRVAVVHGVGRQRDTAETMLAEVAVQSGEDRGAVLAGCTGDRVEHLLEPGLVDLAVRVEVDEVEEAVGDRRDVLRTDGGVGQDAPEAFGHLPQIDLPVTVLVRRAITLVQDPSIPSMSRRAVAEAGVVSRVVGAQCRAIRPSAAEPPVARQCGGSLCSNEHGECLCWGRVWANHELSLDLL
ncbi:hypothetical protein ACWDLL_25545 [Streptomyces griseoincarnatus]